MADETHSLYASYNGGPVNHGDPNDRHISDGERGSLLSRFIQEKLLTDICRTEWQKWHRCIKENSERWLTVYHCRDDFKPFTACQDRHARDPEQMQKFEEEYLQMRSDFRRTGIGHPVMSKDHLREFLKNN